MCARVCVYVNYVSWFLIILLSTFTVEIQFYKISNGRNMQVQVNENWKCLGHVANIGENSRNLHVRNGKLSRWWYGSPRHRMLSKGQMDQRGMKKVA